MERCTSPGVSHTASVCLRVASFPSQPSRSKNHDIGGYYHFGHDRVPNVWDLFGVSPVSDKCNETRQPRLPDPAICRAQSIGFGGLVKCLVDEAVECPFATDYGTGSFCRNPEIHKLLKDP